MMSIRGLACAAIAACAIFVVEAQAQTAWPNKPITFVIPFAAGGGTDAFARPLAAQLDTQLNTRIVLDNRAGAGGTVGASVAAKAAPDGYTFFIGAAHHAIAPALYPKLDYNIETDFAPIGLVAQPPQVIVVHPGKVAAKSVGELIAFAKANPGKLNYGSAGNGTTHHLAGELFQIISGTTLSHVPYRGAGPALQDLVAGHIDLMFDGLGSSAAQIDGGALRALAVASPKRADAFPNVPTSGEAGVANFEVATWYAMWAPKGTPEAIVARMTKELQTALASPALMDAWKRNGSDIPNLYGAPFSTFVSAEVERWGKVVREAKVKID